MAPAAIALSHSLSHLKTLSEAYPELRGLDTFSGGWEFKRKTRGNSLLQSEVFRFAVMIYIWKEQGWG